MDEPHVHSRITEIYLIARGSSAIRVDQETIELSEGDALIVEPGEAHTFLGSSDDYLHFVIHSPGLAGDAARLEKRLVPRSRLGLTETLLRKLFDFARRRGLGHPITSLRSLFP